MRYLVVSDTHGDLRCLFRAMDYLRALKPDALIHLGDFCGDGRLLQKELDVPLYAVAGNCDGAMGADAQQVIQEQGVNILLCHGHQYGVGGDVQRLLYAALERDCAVALFGHTHMPYLEREQGVLLMNPGSLCRPRISQAGVGLLTVEKGSAKGLLLPYCDAM